MIYQGFDRPSGNAIGLVCSRLLLMKIFCYNCSLFEANPLGFMSEFQLYFDLGKDHILDYANGYDHILFVVALCALYISRDWKKILILVTAFTIGHSITLALSTLKIVSVKAELIEFLIPLTIFITAVSNLFKNENNISDGPMQMNYIFATFFGLIHGLGFSNYLKSLSGERSRELSHNFWPSIWAWNSGK